MTALLELHLLNSDTKIWRLEKKELFLNYLDHLRSILTADMFENIIMVSKQNTVLKNPLPYMIRTGARDPSARLLSRDKSTKEPDDSDDEISIPTPSGEMPDSKIIFHKPPKPPKSKYTTFTVGKKIIKEETAKLEEMSAKLRVDWAFLEQKLAEKR